MNQTINISLPKGLNDLAQAQVKAGYFTSVSEVIRHALRTTFMEPSIPTYIMSPKAEEISIKARKEHNLGKTRQLRSLDDLDMLAS
jgi:hypothetical protein